MKRKSSSTKDLYTQLLIQEYKKNQKELLKNFQKAYSNKKDFYKLVEEPDKSGL